jgi:low affinity Fe/Cu permease
MVFLVQNTQNRDSEAIHLKLDELIRATKRAQLADRPRGLQRGGDQAVARGICAARRAQARQAGDKGGE